MIMLGRPDEALVSIADRIMVAAGPFHVARHTGGSFAPREALAMVDEMEMWSRALRNIAMLIQNLPAPPVPVAANDRGVGK